MTAQTRLRWRTAATAGILCLVAAGLATTVWYRATYHVFPGMLPTVVHWCGRDYETGGGTWSWARVTAEEAPRRVRPVGSYPPPFGGRLLLAAPGEPPAGSGEPCAMIVYLRTGQGQFQPYTLEGGP